VVADAIVMAAGEGRRLRPVTERWPKPVLPIDGRPVLGTLLRELAAAGFERAVVVTGHLAEQVRSLAGDGGAWGLAVGYADQPRPDGSADAVVRALAAGAVAPCLVVGADTVFAAGDVGRFVEAAKGRPAIAVRRNPSPAPPHRYAVAFRDGVVTNVLETDRANPFAAAPLWLLSGEIVPHLCKDKPPYELGNAFQAAIEAGVPVSALEIGRTRDLTDPLDLVEENFPYLNRIK
jgi:NDP-sugar pyrophosphorylase family protein